MQRIFFAVLALAVSLLMCEGALRVVAALVPRVDYLLQPAWSRRSPPDSVLGHRVSPFEPGMDARGYRNAVALEHASILALGDSYTFGVPAASNEAWPAVLAGTLGRSVYNAGIIGYGFCEYARVLGSLAGLKPKLVIVGVFSGNDLGDSYRAVYSEARCAELRNADQATTLALAARDAKSTIADDAAALGWDWFSEGTTSRVSASPLRRLTETLRLYGLMREFRHRLTPAPRITYASASGFPNRAGWNARPEIATVFKRPEMMALTVDLSDARIREGLRIGLQSLGGMRDSLAAAGVRFLVVLIPDKASVYVPVMASTAQPAGAQLERLSRLDSEVRRALSSGLDSLGITYVDVTPALVAALQKGVPVYPADDDHHNSAAGYRVIGDVIARSPVLR